MDYIVRVWGADPAGNRSTVDYHEFMDLEDAVAYANAKSDWLRDHDYEFDVCIYELTNF